MIEISKIDVYGWEAAIRGMRNPLNSWERSDSNGSEIGPADLDLMKRLFKAGTEHRKYLRMVHCTLDVNAPLYWWKEFDTYKVATVSNSCSTMHKIAAKEFTREDFAYDHLSEGALAVLDTVIRQLNLSRETYLQSKSKDDWWDMIQLLPSSYMQKRTIDLNYETVFNIMGQRKGHKLDEWRVMVGEFEKLPYVQELLKTRD